MVEVLVSNGLDVEARDYYGNTPLIGATNKGEIEVVKILLENGADVDAKGKDGKTALHIAVYKKHEVFVERWSKCGGEGQPRDDAAVFGSNN